MSPNLKRKDLMPFLELLTSQYLLSYVIYLRIKFIRMIKVFDY